MGLGRVVNERTRWCSVERLRPHVSINVEHAVPVGAEKRVRYHVHGTLFPMKGRQRLAWLGLRENYAAVVRPYIHHWMNKSRIDARMKRCAMKSSW